MSWEVSSMPLKRSFFNRTLFCKNLSRSWPLWGGIAAVGSLVPLYLLLLLIQYGETQSVMFRTADFQSALYGVATYFVPAATLCYSALVAMVVWSYLYQSRSVGFMHTLPIDRTGLFLTNVLSGLAMLLIPYMVVGAFTCVLAMLWGFMDLTAVAMTAAAVVLMAVLFFGVSTLCAMITGNIFALPVFCGIVNFLAPAMDLLVTSLAKCFLLGVHSEYTGVVAFLSPVVEIYGKFEWDSFEVAADLYEYRLMGFGTVAVYGLVGVGCFALAWLLYRRRDSERAGDVVAFQWLRPVFRYGVALCSALTLGRLLYAMLWESLFQAGSYADVLPMAVCLAVAGVVGYYAASMLLEKTLRVFRGSLPGAAAVVAACALICVGASMDLLGVEGYVPEPEDIDTVYVYASDMVGNSPTLSAKEHPELVAMVLDLHSAVVAEADEIKADQNREYGIGGRREFSYQYLRLEYTMQDGTVLKRRYPLYLKREAWEQETGFEAAFKALFTSAEFQKRQILGYPGGEVEHIYVYNYSKDKDDNTLNTDRIHAALLKDAAAGNLYDFDPFDEYYNDSYPIEMGIEYRFRKQDGSYIHSDTWIGLRPTMAFTLQELLDQEYITPEDLKQWNDERGLKTDYSDYTTLIPVVVGG